MIAVASQPPGLHTGAGRVILARHATPDWNRRDIPYDIPPGPELTPAGEREALALGEFLRAQGATRVYHSPLERTLRTASLAASVCGADTQIAEHETTNFLAVETIRFVCAR